MVRAIWNNMILAESRHTVEFDNAVYFPPESINRRYFNKSPRSTRCYWKGKARYYDVKINGATNHAAAWYYPHPLWLAREIKDYVAFGNDVTIVRD